ncbi:MAG TPA: thiol peroxidase [Planctomycetota bacterium]|nr:thiol peroxidase [Planctomycetota bacterium]
MATERTGIVTMKGNPVTLIGPELKPGAKAPEFRVVDGSLQPVTLASTSGKVRLISVVPSLDTPVCSTQTKTFNAKLSSLPSDVEVLTISVDLPFAQKRFCGAENVSIRTLSDYQDRSFGENWGVLIKELKLLARSVFVVDRNDTIAYVEIVPEVTSEPNYDRAIEAAKNAAG